MSLYGAPMSLASGASLSGPNKTSPTTPMTASSAYPSPNSPMDGAEWRAIVVAGHREGTVIKGE